MSGVVLAGLPALAAPASAADCPNAAAATVPGAERQEQACLADLATAGTQTSGHTDRSDWEGLNASGTKNPTGVPGLGHAPVPLRDRVSGLGAVLVEGGARAGVRRRPARG